MHDFSFREITDFNCKVTVKLTAQSSLVLCRELSLRKADPRALKYAARMRQHADGARIPYRPGSYHYIKEGKRFRQRMKELLHIK